MKNIKKPLLIFICAIVMIAIVAVGLSSKDSGENATTPEGSVTAPEAETTQNSEKPPETEPVETEQPAGLSASKPEPEPVEAAGDLGDYHVEIKDFSLEKDHSGNPAIVISFDFTNNSDEAASAMVALSEKAFQNGISLQSAYFMDDSIVDSSMSMKDIQPGTTIELKKGYLLSSETAPVEFEVEETFSWDNALLGKTFEISEGGQTVYSVAPTGSIGGELGDYSVYIISSEIGEDYDGDDVLIVHYGFTNNGKKDASFSLALSVSLFQNGIELERAYFANDDNDASLLYAKPGAGLEIIEAYELQDTVSPVDVEIEELISFSDEKITTTIQLK